MEEQRPTEDPSSGEPIVAGVDDRRRFLFVLQEQFVSIAFTVHMHASKWIG